MGHQESPSLSYFSTLFGFFTIRTSREDLSKKTNVHASPSYKFFIFKAAERSAPALPGEQGLMWAEATPPGPHLDVLEHVRVVANLPQLHDGVHQGLGTTFALRRHK